MREESRRQGLARQALGRVQRRIESLLAAGEQGHGGHRGKEYYTSLCAACILSNLDLVFCTMEWIGVGLVFFSPTETGLDP